MRGARDGESKASNGSALDLDRLQAQVELLRATLARIQGERLETEARLASAQPTALVEANERLVIAALRAQTDAETAAEEAARMLGEVARNAELDPLTKLPNRVLLLDRFAQAINHTKRHRGRMALLFLDLNSFKLINDTLGHTVGDAVLQLVAQRLAASIREADTVSRHGGDEFLVLLSEISHASDAGRIAGKVLAALAAPSRVGDHVLRLTASIGISIYPDDAEDADILIDRADVAMFRAKRHGFGSFVFHGEALPGDRTATTTTPALTSPLSNYEAALAEHDQRHELLRDANQQLVLSALDAGELKAAAELAQQRQTEFLAMLAHELRNPLAPIRTAAALLGRVAPDAMLLSRVQTVIERQVEHIARLVSDLLDVSRVTTGKLGLEFRVVEISAVIAAAVDACRPAMDTRLQRFDIRAPVAPIEVRGDPVRLTQILTNLLDNASKYTPDGGEITLQVEVQGGSAILTVSDTGIGITTEALPAVFEPFVQDPNALGFPGVGLGIGLTVVRELVEGHGGLVIAHSEGSGRGSQFVVSLPLHRAEVGRSLDA